MRECITMVLFSTFLTGLSVLVVLASCQMVLEKKLNEEQGAEYYECVSEGGNLEKCWCHAKNGGDEKAYDVCMELSK